MVHASPVKRGVFATDRKPSESVEVVPTTRLAGRRSSRVRDSVAREEPLEIQLDGTSLTVLMRTPGHDEELALGLLWSERVIESLADVTSVRHATLAPNPEAADNIMQIRLREGVRVDWQRLEAELLRERELWNLRQGDDRRRARRGAAARGPLEVPRGLVLSAPGAAPQPPRRRSARPVACTRPASSTPKAGSSSFARTSGATTRSTR